MKRMLFVLCAFSMATSAWAGNIEDVKTAVKNSCNKEIERAEAINLVKKLFLTCAPGTKVDLDGGCQVSCLKSNSGAVVGQ